MSPPAPAGHIRLARNLGYWALATVVAVGLGGCGAARPRELPISQGRAAPEPISYLPASRRAILQLNGFSATYTDRVRAMRILDVVTSGPRVGERHGSEIHIRVTKRDLVNHLWAGVNHRHTNRRWQQIERSVLVLSLCSHETGVAVAFDGGSDEIVFHVGYQGRRVNGPQAHPDLMRDAGARRRGEVCYVAYPRPCTRPEQPAVKDRQIRLPAAT